MKKKLTLLFSVYFISFGLLQNLSAQTIDFSKEKPIHPYYETMDENYSIDCKEKQLCMENCKDSFTLISNKFKDKNNARLGCFADCRKIVCFSKNKK
ncbi:Hypothetical protein LBF_2162 [Leptospira biflexa serovar Patoc strain 'Patoc 1 (Ames)']|uniref:Uncharacterized protein n=1 Tax=Leptospira biflexa serovar Patoc (strain Patoc 1 / ATCC 23582 / Paris) TaxID=456481 RepID=B0ST82_LEPBP|nr:Hypothetical protein LBF_2162 [Leptospira biflexa serovar Patoc strain 'Patoc 1 (Ames)']ABZ98322.1 Hypothetical protein; putative signal peptide [Leptospira biflexa serovar Patoc strain 'Patoc 1 (Paris)']